MDDESTDPAATESAVADLEKDVVFEILKNRRRRNVLHHLREFGEVSLGELAERIAAEENDTTVEALSADERKRVYIGLYQTHLPKMDDAGVVEYDQDRGAVAPGPAIDQLYPYLEPADGKDTDGPGGAITTLDLSGLDDTITIPAWGFLAALLLVGLLTVAATAIPGPVWAAVLVIAAVVATVLVRWA